MMTMSKKRQKTNIFFYAEFNLAELLELARRLRGVTCSCDSTQKPFSGSFNWAIILTFADGVEWLFRAPWTSYGLDEETARAVLASEAATLKYIRQNSSVPVPVVHHYCASKENSIGVPFILMSRATGVPLSNYSWRPQPCEPISSQGRRCLLRVNEKRKIMQQLGVIMSQLSRLRFNKIGSLFEEKECFKVGPCLAPGLLLRDRHTLQGIPRGPFNTESEYYKGLLSAYFADLRESTLEHHAFFAPVPVPTEYDRYSSYLAATDRWNDFVALDSKIENSQNRLDYFVAGLFLESMIPILAGYLEESSSDQPDGFPLYHPDLSLNNIFIDEHHNITCIIDWAFSFSAPSTILLSTPGLPHPRDEWEPTMTSAFRSGFTVNLDDLQDYHYFAELYTLIYDRPAEELFTKFQQQYAKHEVINMQQALSADDQSPSEIKRNERAYFNNVGVDRHALAAKLRLASVLNRSFVADRRLWRWIEEAVNLRETM
uniref:Uncharacterized protein n=1 Tax=Coccidioides posadasii RMSCC 3488 TaxID=454284 RepID=A0A0J6FJ12_COCPO|nr:hypothetical protein CPAG_05711 [Coccidioides posadasii RMSCC 3488]